MQNVKPLADKNGADKGEVSVSKMLLEYIDEDLDLFFGNSATREPNAIEVLQTDAVAQRDDDTVTEYKRTEALQGANGVQTVRSLVRWTACRVVEISNEHENCSEDSKDYLSLKQYRNFISGKP